MGCTCAIFPMIPADTIDSLPRSEVRGRCNLGVCRYGKGESCEKKAFDDKHLDGGLRHRFRDDINE